MKKNGKKLVVTLVIALMLGVFGVNYSLVTHAEEASTRASVEYYDFYLTLPKAGVTDLATARTKVSSASNAFYTLSTITNTTGKSLYINVRNSSGSAIVGKAVEVGTPVKADSFWVDYLSGYGNVGTKYRPSGQTSSSSTKPAYVEGSWRP